MQRNLSEIFLFENLDEETLKQIEAITTETKFPKDSIVFYEGDEPNSLYILLSGIIKLYKVTSSDREIVLKYFYENELIAEVASFEGINYPATAQAFTDIEVLKIDFNKLKEFIFVNPELSYKIMTSLVKKIRNLESLVSSHLVLDSKERVAKFIHDNPEEFFKTKNVMIAEVLNISPETLSRVLRVFKDEKLVDSKLKQVNKEGLKSYFS